ncbi:hypothetical protein CMK12_10030 [Candidatus Poribacteria bacterium]|jgi:hypothetical protein|nr:hypothetical protein [Candidatus Poribacteria bacterium]MDP6994664.1 hypothetical protein [Candidatus Poribacteria bacterium]
MNSEVFQVGELTAVIGDNSADDDHRAGYNGIWSLTHQSSQRNLFVPAYAGWNLEHIFDGYTNGSAEVFYEPRHAPMAFHRLSDNQAELYQPPTPTFHLESWTCFKLVAPYYIDVDFRCLAHQPLFKGNYIGLFWASYINAPLDKSIYFQSENGYWAQLCTQQHNNESTVCHLDDQTQLTFSQDYHNALFRNLSPFRYQLPLFYGLFEDLAWVVMFDRTEGIRLTHSPSGGGSNQQYQTTNPAWDFQLIVPNYQVQTEYGFKARLVYRPTCSRRAILDEYYQWRKLIDLDY